MTYSSFCALFRPSTFAELMGIPYQTQASSKNAENKTSAFFIQFAGREFALALILGILVYLDEIKVLSWVLLAIGVAGVADTTATWKYGVKGAWKVHFYPTVLAAFVVPVALLLE
jgi:hypothetical protein